MQENQNNQHEQQFTQAELQQIKDVLSSRIETLEYNAKGWKHLAHEARDACDVANKNHYFAAMIARRNQAKKLAKLQKKVKVLLAGGV